MLKESDLNTETVWEAMKESIQQEVEKALGECKKETSTSIK